MRALALMMKDTEARMRLMNDLAADYDKLTGKAARWDGGGKRKAQIGGAGRFSEAIRRI